jgi:hypothetical protein
LTFPFIPTSSLASLIAASRKNSLSSTFPHGNAQKFGQTVVLFERFMRST